EDPRERAFYRPFASGRTFKSDAARSTTLSLDGVPERNLYLGRLVVFAEPFGGARAATNQQIEEAVFRQDVAARGRTPATVASTYQTRRLGRALRAPAHRECRRQCNLSTAEAWFECQRTGLSA